MRVSYQWICRDNNERLIRQLFIFAGIIVSVFFVCSKSRIEGLFMDDLETWRTWLEHDGLLSYLMQDRSLRLRPITDLVMGIGFSLITIRTDLLWLWMLAINMLTAFVLYFVCKSIVKNEIYSFIGRILFVFSRFGYYANSQYTGLMEQTATIFSLLLLYEVSQALTDQEPGNHILYAGIYTVLAAFTHERYMVMTVLVFLAALLTSTTRKNKLIFLAESICCLVFILLVRYCFLGDNSWTGTRTDYGEDTSVLSTFSLSSFFTNIFMGCVYLFGFNVGADYLCGYTTGVTPVSIYFLYGTAWVIILVYLVLLFRSKRLFNNWKLYFLIIAYIGGTLISGCITVRFEQRWLYSPFAGFVILLILAIRDVSVNSMIKKVVLPILLFTCMISAEYLYHGGYGMIFSWHPQNAYDSIYNETINGKESLEGKRIVIICDVVNSSSHINQGELSNFYRAYAEAGGYESPEVAVYNSFYEAVFTEKDAYILSIEWPHNYYEDIPVVKNITEEFKQINEISRPVGNTIRKAAQLAGFSWWEGWEQEYIWSEETASMRIATGETGTAKLTGKMKSYNIPNNLSVYFNNELIQSFPLNSEDVDITFVLPANSEGILRLELDSTIAPYDVGESDDRRSLGICIYELIVE